MLRGLSGNKSHWLGGGQAGQHISVGRRSWTETILDLDSRNLAKITYCTLPLTLIVSGNHWELIQLWVIPSSFSPGVLLAPWLREHNQQFNWTEGSLTGWSVPYLSNCFHWALPPSPSLWFLSWWTPIFLQFQRIIMFLSEQRALSMPPHRHDQWKWESTFYRPVDIWNIRGFLVLLQTNAVLLFIPHSGYTGCWTHPRQLQNDRPK